MLFSPLPSLLDSFTLGVSQFYLSDPLHSRSFLSLAVLLYGSERSKAIAYSFYCIRLLVSSVRTSPALLGAHLGLGGAIGLYVYAGLLFTNILSLITPAEPKLKSFDALDRENTVPMMEDKVCYPVTYFLDQPNSTEARIE